jgi:putative membrane protein
MLAALRGGTADLFQWSQAMKQATLAAATLLAFVLPVHAQTAANQPTKQFVKKAAIGDMFEVQSSQMALEKSNNNDIKKFARMIVDDHTKASNELKSLVHKMRGMQVPTSLDAEHQRKLDQLRSASGPQFDERYRTEQIEGHQVAVKLFEDYSNKGDNTELKSWAQKTLPTLRNHLQHAQAGRDRAPAH